MKGYFTFQLDGGGGLFFRWGGAGFIFKWGRGVPHEGTSILMGWGFRKKRWMGAGAPPSSMGSPGTLYEKGFAGRDNDNASEFVHLNMKINK